METRPVFAYHQPHPITTLPTLTVVRPWDGWLRSYFDYVGRTWVRCDEVDALQVLRRDTFDNFVRQLIDDMPDQIARIRDAYASDYTVTLGDVDGFRDAMKSIGYSGFEPRSEPANVSTNRSEWNADLLAEFKAKCL